MKQISLFSYIKLGGYMKIEIIDYNYFYFNIFNISNIYKIVEYGEFIYGDRINNILNKAILI